MVDSASELKRSLRKCTMTNDCIVSIKTQWALSTMTALAKWWGTRRYSEIIKDWYLSYFSSAARISCCRENILIKLIILIFREHYYTSAKQRTTLISALRRRYLYLVSKIQIKGILCYTQYICHTTC